MQAILDDQIVKAQGMCASPFVKPFEEEAKGWSVTLNTLQDVLDNWLKARDKSPVPACCLRVYILG